MLAPLDDRIIVKPDAYREDVTSAGLLVKTASTIESQKQLGRTGTVVAVGPGKRHPKTRQRIPLTLQVGERVIYGEFGADTHREWQEDDGQKYVILQEADVCGVIDPIEN